MICSLWPECFSSVLKSLILDQDTFLGVFAKVSDVQDWIWSEVNVSKKIIFITSNIKSPCIIFFVNQRFYIFVKPGWISVINCNYVMRDKVWEYVFRKVFKCPFPRKICDWFFYSIWVRISVMPDFPFIWWRIVNLKFKFSVNYLMMTTGM